MKKNITLFTAFIIIIFTLIFRFDMEARTYKNLNEKLFYLSIEDTSHILPQSACKSSKQKTALYALAGFAILVYELTAKENK